MMACYAAGNWRLILGGKMHPDEATELKALFFGDK